MATLIFDEVFLKHDLPTHPENALRLKYFLKTASSFPIKWIKPKPVTYELLRSVHSENYIQEVKLLSEEGIPGFIEPDTYYNRYTYIASVFAAGAAELAVELSLRGEKKIFCAVRPPGHHATKDRAMGFCFFNNVVIGAVKALISGYKKVFIVDFDAHHGNGTQELIGNYSEIFYFSTHQYPFYPGTGSKEENKENIFNIPLPAGTGDKEYKEIYENIFPEKVSNFAPEIILVSAGYEVKIPYTNIDT